jgi:hypothetical protein
LEEEKLAKSNKNYDNLSTEIQNATFDIIGTFDEKVEIFAGVKLSDGRSQVNLKKILTKQQEKLAAIESEKNATIQFVDNY